METDRLRADRMDPGSSPAQVRYDQPWLASVLRPLLIAVLVACVDIALLAFLLRFAPEIGPAYLESVVFLGVFAALVGCVTTTWLAQPSQRLQRTFAYRLAELTLLLLLTRLAIWAVTSSWPSPVALILAPLSTGFDILFLMGAAVVALSWGIGSEMTSDMLAIALQADEMRMAEGPRDRTRDTARAAYTDRRSVLLGFVSRWVTGGIILIILAAGARVDTAEHGFLAMLRQHIDPVVVAAIVVYFLAGLLLISHGQLALLRARWTLEHIPSTPSILRNWPGYVFVLLAVIALLASLLPFGGTLWLARAIAFVINVVYLVVFAFLHLLNLLLVLVLSLLPLGNRQPPPPTPAAADLEPARFQPPPQALVWASGTLFWLALALLIGYAALLYFTDAGARPRWLTWLWEALRLRWQQLFGAFGQWRAAHIRGSLAGAPSIQASARRGFWDHLRWRRLAPDQRVRYFYLSTIEQAAQAGVPRSTAETPIQYAPRLTQAVQDEPSAHADQAVEEITRQFVRVRYGGDHVDAEQLPRIEHLWHALIEKLRNLIST